MFVRVAEGVGFEPTVRLPVRLISSQVPLTTQPPFQPLIGLVSNRMHYAPTRTNGNIIRQSQRGVSRQYHRDCNETPHPSPLPLVKGRGRRQQGGGLPASLPSPLSI